MGKHRGWNVVGAIGVRVGVGGGERGAAGEAGDQRGGVVGRSAPELRFIVGDMKKDGTGVKDGAAKSR
jgi:hypothetical protein